jgi:hypothetical protein
MLHFGAEQGCSDAAAFERDMTAMFSRECNIYSKRGIDVDRVRLPSVLSPLQIFSALAWIWQRAEYMLAECTSARLQRLEHVCQCRPWMKDIACAVA